MVRTSPTDVATSPEAEALKSAYDNQLELIFIPQLSMFVLSWSSSGKFDI
jgi:hypothetical protein